jgi:dTDP-4-amino-4,6-dideoxygalactose transaminase
VLIKNIVQRIDVTEPFLPPLEEYVEYLAGIWERNWLTNQGPLVKEFERKLQDYHGLSTSVHCVANGALGLQIALKALGVKGEVITTPFSYVATTSCPLWEGCHVKFADIEPDYLTLDPKAVEAAISPKTEAIIGTHVFGNPCDCEALESIAKRHGLALIFDAAHAFGVRYKGKSILEYGDASMVSLHATKLMHAVEGGFVVAKDPAVSSKVEWMRRFGHNGHEAFHGAGINAKMSEFHAAMGLCVLRHISRLLSRRSDILNVYRNNLSGYGTHCRMLDIRKETVPNHAYAPVMWQREQLCVDAQSVLLENSIIPRRYFYPLLDCLGEAHPEKYPTAIDASNRIMCLPLYDSLKVEQVEDVCLIIGQEAKGKTL